MKVAYVLNTPNAANYKVGEMILPQLESDSHGVDVVGIFFFDDNTMLLQKGNPKGERLAKIAAEKAIFDVGLDILTDSLAAEIEKKADEEIEGIIASFKDNLEKKSISKS